MGLDIRGDGELRGAAASVEEPVATKGSDAQAGAWWFAVALGCSGAAALTYQVVWFRILHRVFGATALAATMVLAVFMVGLGLGAHLAGRYADRSAPRRCLRGYIALEIAVGIFAALTPHMMSGLVELHVLTASLTDLGPAKMALRTLACALVLLPPTTAMGASLPLLMRATRCESTTVTRMAGMLYAANNFGAVVGAITSGFVLLGALGDTRTVLVAVGLNLAAAAVAAVALRHVPANAEAAPPETPSQVRDRVPLHLWIAAAVAGFVMLAYEIVWTRVLVPLLGSTVYAFSAMLASVLLGLTLGSALAAQLADRPDRAVLRFGLLVAASAASALLGIRYSTELIVPTLQLWMLSDGFYFRFLVAPLLVSCALVLLPTTLSGMALPLGIRCVAARRGAARSTGMLYAANTTGSIAGALCAGMLLIPWLGIGSAAAAIAFAGIASGAITALHGLPKLSERRWAIAGTALLMLWAATQPRFPIELFAGGIHMTSERQREMAIRYGVDMRLQGSELLYVGEGRQTTVLVERRFGRRAFFVDGKPEASDGILDMRNQYLLGHVPGLLHPRPERALVVGLGTGMTAGALSRHAQVDVAELNELVPEVARVFKDLNHDVVDSKRVRITNEDGRVFLAERTAKYDIISVDPIHPYVAGASTLYTRDYFAAVRDHLRPGGIAAHWLPLYQLGWDEAAGVIRSFADVFPDATVYQTGRDAILIGNAGRSPATAARFAMHFDRAGVREDLARVLIDSPAELAVTATVGPAEIAALVGAGRLITDDHRWIEFTSPQWFQHPTVFNVARIASRRRPLWDGATDDERAAYDSFTAILEDTTADSPKEAIAALERGLASHPNARELRLRLDQKLGRFETGAGF